MTDRAMKQDRTRLLNAAIDAAYNGYYATIDAFDADYAAADAAALAAYRAELDRIREEYPDE